MPVFPRNTPEWALRKHTDAHVAACNCGDAKGVAGLFDVEAVLTTPTGAVHCGREAIASAHTLAFAASAPGRLQLAIESIRYVKPDVTVVQGRFETSWGQGRKGGEPRNSNACTVKPSPKRRCVARGLRSGNDSHPAGSAWSQEFLMAR